MRTFAFLATTLALATPAFAYPVTVYPVTVMLERVAVIWLHILRP